MLIGEEFHLEDLYLLPCSPVLCSLFVGVNLKVAQHQQLLMTSTLLIATDSARRLRDDLTHSQVACWKMFPTAAVMVVLTALCHYVVVAQDAKGMTLITTVAAVVRRFHRRDKRR